jgi:hypothetical protein
MTPDFFEKFRQSVKRIILNSEDNPAFRKIVLEIQGFFETNYLYTNNEQIKEFLDVLFSFFQEIDIEHLKIISDNYLRIINDYRTNDEFELKKRTTPRILPSIGEQFYDFELYEQLKYTQTIFLHFFINVGEDSKFIIWNFFVNQNGIRPEDISRLIKSDFNLPASIFIRKSEKLSVQVVKYLAYNGLDDDDLISIYLRKLPYLMDEHNKDAVDFLSVLHNKCKSKASIIFSKLYEEKILKILEKDFKDLTEYEMGTIRSMVNNFNRNPDFLVDNNYLLKLIETKDYAELESLQLRIDWNDDLLSFLNKKITLYEYLQSDRYYNFTEFHRIDFSFIGEIDDLIFARLICLIIDSEVEFLSKIIHLLPVKYGLALYIYYRKYNWEYFETGECEIDQDILFNKQKAFSEIIKNQTIHDCLINFYFVEDFSVIYKLKRNVHNVLSKDYRNFLITDTYTFLQKIENHSWSSFFEKLVRIINSDLDFEFFILFLKYLASQHSVKRNQIIGRLEGRSYLYNKLLVWSTSFFD